MFAHLQISSIKTLDYGNFSTQLLGKELGSYLPHFRKVHAFFQGEVALSTVFEHNFYFVHPMYNFFHKYLDISLGLWNSLYELRIEQMEGMNKWEPHTTPSFMRWANAPMRPQVGNGLSGMSWINSMPLSIPTQILCSTPSIELLGWSQVQRECAENLGI